MEREEFAEENKLEKYPDIYNAIRRDDWRKLIFFMETSPTAMEIIIGASTDESIFSDLVLNVLIAYKKIALALDLIPLMEPEMLEMKNFNGDTALHMAVANENIIVASALLNKNSNLISLRNLNGETPLLKAALNGMRDLFWDLHHRGAQIKDRRFDGATVLHCALMTNHFGLALEIAGEFPDLVDLRDQLGLTALHHILSIPAAFRSCCPLGLVDSILYKCIIVRKGPYHDPIPQGDEENVVEMETTGEKQFRLIDNKEEDIFLFHEKGQSNEIKKQLKKIFKPAVQWLQMRVNQILRITEFKEDLIEQKTKHWCAIKLVALIAKRQEYWFSLIGGSFPKHDSASEQKRDKLVQRWMETPLTLGTRMNLDELVLRILNIYPRAAEIKGKEGKNVLHVAVENRREAIVKVMTNVGDEMDPRLSSRLLSTQDEYGNTILHLAATAVDQTSSPLHMRGEFKWFEKVKEMVPIELVNHRNKDGKTAQEVFTETHKNMVDDAKRQLTNTARTCCAALVSAVTFAAGFSIATDQEKKNKGGYGHGMAAFKIFSHAYTMGLSCAATALLQFMALLVSSYKEEDFRRSLPTQYVLALLSLLLAMLAMLVAFGCNTYVSLYGELQPDWTKYLPYAVEIFIFPISCLIVLYCRGIKIDLSSIRRSL